MDKIRLDDDLLRRKAAREVFLSGKFRDCDVCVYPVPPCSRMTVAEQSHLYSQVGRKVVAEHPLAYINLACHGFAMMMLTGSPASLAGLTGMNFNWAAKVLLLYTIPALGFALLCLWQCWRRLRPFFWLAGLIVTYFVVLSVGEESFARFRVPIVPVYGVLIAVGVDSIWRSMAPALRGGMVPPRERYNFSNAIRHLERRHSSVPPFLSARQALLSSLVLQH